MAVHLGLKRHRAEHCNAVRDRRGRGTADPNIPATSTPAGPDLEDPYSLLIGWCGELGACPGSERTRGQR